MLPIIDDIDLDLSDLGLEEVFLADNQPKVEEDDVLCPKQPPPPPPFILDNQTRLTYSLTIDSKQ